MPIMTTKSARELLDSTEEQPSATEELNALDQQQQPSASAALDEVDQAPLQQGGKSPPAGGVTGTLDMKQLRDTYGTPSASAAMEEADELEEPVVVYDRDNPSRNGVIRTRSRLNSLKKRGFKVSETNPASAEAVETPWISPVDAVAGAGGAGFVKGGVKTALKILPKELAIEPFIGTAQSAIDKGLTKADAPAAVKMPANMLTGLIVGDMLATGSKAQKTIKSVRAKGQSLRGQNVRQENLRDAWFNLENQKQYTPEGQAQMRAAQQENTGFQLAEGAKSFYQKYIGTPVWDKVIMDFLPRMVEKAPKGQKLTQALMERRHPNMSKGESDKFTNLLQDMEVTQTLGGEYALDIGKRLQQYAPQERQIVGQYLRGEIGNVPDKLKPITKESFDALTAVGKEATDVGLLKEDTFFKNWGIYFPRFYTSKEYDKALNRFGVSKPNKMDMARFKQRKDIPEDMREAMGEITDPSYPLARGLEQITSDVQKQKLFNSIAANKAWARKPSEGPKTEKWQQIPDDTTYGNLRNRYVHPDIAEHVMEMGDTTSRGELGQAWDKLLSTWKYGKTVASPATHMRNMFSNAFLGHIGGMPLRHQPKYLARAAQEMGKGGDYYKMMKEQGLLKGSFIRSEISSRLFDDIATEIRPGDPAKQTDGIHSIGDTMNAIGRNAKTAAKRAADLYQAEEHLYKSAKFMHNIEQKGMDPRQAANDAEKWLFDYNKLTNFQRMYRRSPLGHPFATFSFKAIPRVAETAVKAPWRFAAPVAISQGIKELALQQEGEDRETARAKRKFLPDWMKGGFPMMPNYQRVPVPGGDKEGTDRYLNMRYIYPWGDVAEEQNFASIPFINDIPQGLEPLSQPGIRLGMELMGNYDMFREEKVVQPEDIVGRTKTGRWAESGKQAWRKIANEMLPAPFADAGAFIKRAQGKGDYKGRLESWGSLLAENFAGIKTRSVDWRDQIISKTYQKSKRGRELDQKITTLANKRQKAAKRGDTERVKELEKKIEYTAIRMERHAESWEGDFGNALKALQEGMEGSD